MSAYSSGRRQQRRRRHRTRVNGERRILRFIFIFSHPTPGPSRPTDTHARNIKYYPSARFPYQSYYGDNPFFRPAARLSLSRFLPPRRPSSPAAREPRTGRLAATSLYALYPPVDRINRNVTFFLCFSYHSSSYTTMYAVLRARQVRRRLTYNFVVVNN